MNKNKQTLTKACSVCGQQKPLSAFLQLGGDAHTIYGSVCASCRSAGLDKPRQSNKTEESTSSTTGFKIDSKAKVQAEKDKRSLRQSQEELETEDHRKEAEKQTIRGVKKEITTKEDRTRRESLLGQHSFLDSKHKIKPDDAMATQAVEEQKIDLSSPVVDTQIVKLKHNSSLLKQFKYGVLGGASPFAQNEVKKTSDKEFIEKNFGPKRSR